MKNATRIFSAVLTFLMILSLGVPAFADAKYESTADFLEEMTNYSDVECSVVGIEGDNAGNQIEIVQIQYDGELVREPLEIYACFTEDNESILLRIYDLITVPEEKLADAVIGTNALNAAFSWVKFYVEPEDRTVTAETDVIVRPESAAELGGEGMIHLITVTEMAMDLLNQYAA